MRPGEGTSDGKEEGMREKITSDLREGTIKADSCKYKGSGGEECNVKVIRLISGSR